MTTAAAFGILEAAAFAFGLQDVAAASETVLSCSGEAFTVEHLAVQFSVAFVAFPTALHNLLRSSATDAVLP